MTKGMSVRMLRARSATVLGMAVLVVAGCATGDFRSDATRRALLGLGYLDADIEDEPMRVPLGWTSPQPPAGAVYAVHIGQAACVIGDVRPERVLVEVAGAAVEYGCLEPFSH
jgi:hypothetical protein